MKKDASRFKPRRWRPSAAAVGGSSARWFLLTVAVCTALSLFIRTGFPAEIWAGAGADDALFVRLARSLVAGHWLGHFDELTLVKGIGYPAFVGLAFLIGIPLKLFETIVYLLCSAAVSFSVARWSRSYPLASILFAALALNPVQWSANLSRVLRECLYIPLSLAALALTVALLVSPARSKVWATALSLTAGVVWGWFWLTREEGVWLIPSAVVVVAIMLVGLWRSGTVSGLRDILRTVAPLGIAALAAVLLVSGVATINRFAYGRFETVEVKSAPFERAYGALYRIVPTKRVRYVVFPIDVRERLYRVSPAARELQPYFDGPRAELWRQVGCRSGYRAQCAEIVAGWFQWAFREAVAQAGHYQNAATSAAYYDRLADEINAGCSAGKLICLPPRQTLVPPFEPAFLRDAAADFPMLARQFWREGLHLVPPGASAVIPGETTTDAARVAIVADLVGNAMPTIDEASGSRAASLKRDHAIWRIADLIGLVYSPILVMLLLASPAGLYFLYRTATTLGDYALIALVAASMVGVVVRSALLCFLDATAIPSLNAQYASPASTLLIVVAFVAPVGAALKWHAQGSRLKTNPSHQEAACPV